MNVLELFAGIGGIGLGLERAGMTVVGQVEIDPYCQRVLAKHWPEVPRHDDVRTCVEWWRSEPRPDIDLIAGGFPCQTVSVAGQRRGQSDERWLWPDMALVVRTLRPRWVLVENVPGLLAPIAIRDDEDRVIGYVRAPVEDVLGDLAALGYDAEWDGIPTTSRAWPATSRASAGSPLQRPSSRPPVRHSAKAALTWPNPSTQPAGPPMADPTAGSVELTADQQRRIAALRAAREVLVARALASSEGADPIDLHSIAEYIVTGNDPWPPRSRPPTPGHRLWWRRTDG